jgi:hypothetical protein
MEIMSKHHQHRQTVTEIVADKAAENAVTEIAATPLLPQADEPQASAPRAFEVEYPGCLIGKQVIVAADAEAACEAYRESCGMTSNSRPPVVSELPAANQ